MKSVLIILIINILAGFYSPAYARNEHILELKKRKVCAVHIDSSLNQFDRLMNFWFDKEGSSLNIFDAFEKLKSYHLEYYGYVKKISEKALTTPNTFEELAGALRGIDLVHSEALSKMTQVFNADHDFYLSLYSLERALVNLSEEIDGILAACPSSGFEEPLNEMKDVIKKGIETVNFMRAYVHDCKIKRANIYTTALQTTKLELKRKYSQKLNVTLASTIQKIEQVLEVDRLYTEVLEWWNRIALLNGLAGSLHTKYLQYEEPLRVMRANLQEAQEYLLKLNSLPAENQRLVAMVKEEILKYQNALTSEISSLTSSGWRGQLGRQIYLHERRLSLSRSSYSAFCLRTIKEHLELAKKTTQLSEYRYVERLYLTSIRLCEGK